MAQLGFRKMEDMCGRVDLLDMRQAVDHWKAKGVDLSKILYQMPAKKGVAVKLAEKQDHGLEGALDHKLIKAAKAALGKSPKPVQINDTVKNVNRTVGAMLSGEVARKFGHAGLPDETTQITLTGTAGQSFCAFLARGVTLNLIGDGNV